MCTGSLGEKMLAMTDGAIGQDEKSRQTFLNILVVISSGPHQSRPKRLGNARLNTKVQVWFVRTPEKALIVKACNFTVQDGSRTESCLRGLSIINLPRCQNRVQPAEMEE